MTKYFVQDAKTLNGSWIEAASVTEALRHAAGLPRAQVGEGNEGDIVHAWLGDFFVHGRRYNVVRP